MNANYIYDLYSQTNGNNLIVEYWDLYDQDEYYFYAYYRKEIYDYYYYYANTNGVTDAVSNANANVTAPISTEIISPSFKMCFSFGIP